MPLQVTPVNRNLQTRVTFMLLELEDLFVVLGAAAIMNVVGHFVGGEVAGMPMSIVLQYGVPLLLVPLLTAFTILVQCLRSFNESQLGVLAPISYSAVRHECTPPLGLSLSNQSIVCYNLHAGQGQMFCGAWYPWYPLTLEIGDMGWNWWKWREPWGTRKDSKYAGFQQT